MNEYRKTTLANGLRVVTVEMPHLHSAEMACYVKVGGRNEDLATAGISHFLEHMIFRGTGDYPTSLELERAFEAIGGAVNAATDAESTCYHSRLHPERIAEGAALFASMLRRPLLADLEIERRIILEEALEDLNERGEEVNPDNLTARLLWPGHPLSLPTIGTRDSIRGLGPEALRRYHTAYYIPENTVLVVAGPVRHEAVTAAAAEHFGDWQGAVVPPTLLHPGSDGQGSPETIWVHDSDSQVSVQFAFRLPGRQSPHAVPLRVLRRILSGGGTSRLMLRLRETLGLTYSVEANLSLFEECGCFSIDFSVAPENLAEAAREVLAVLTEICREPVPEAELARVVRCYLYDLDFSRDHADDMTVRYGWGELVSYLRTLEDDRREITGADAETLLATARELFVPGALKVAFAGPFAAKDRKVVEKLLAGYRQGV
ncbi:MAG TPA: pitrilysin family protein [Desulfuromonadales bacterium]|jgi:predicted Zn-dependent peptidase